MKLVIIFTAIMTTSAFAQVQLSPELMRAEMSRAVNASEWNNNGVRMCPPDIEYKSMSVKMACGGDQSPCPQDASCNKHYLDCYQQWSKDSETIRAYNVWTKTCYSPKAIQKGR